MRYYAKRQLVMRLELLAPAKNAAFGKEAVNHGADALYVVPPQQIPLRIWMSW